MIRVNGKDIESYGATVGLMVLLSNQGFNPDRVAVEVNGVIIKKSEYAEAVLCDGDKVEIVCFVGGG